MEVNKIYHGDCLELFKNIPTDFVQTTFADPPFNLRKKYRGHKDNMTQHDYLCWCDKWLAEMVRVTKPNGSIFIHNIPYWLSYYCCCLNEIEEISFKHWISWDSPTAPMGKSLQPAHYGILYYSKGEECKFNEIRYLNKRCRECRYLLKDYGGKKDTIPEFGPLVSDVWTDMHRVKHNKYKDEHPCQLPIHLLERIILMSTDEGDVVLDPFMGTGTTAVAAKRLGRQYIGFEKSKEYVEVAEIKLEKEKELSKIDNVWVSKFGGHRGMCKVVTIRSVDWKLLKSHFDLPSETKKLNSKEISLKRNQ